MTTEQGKCPKCNSEKLTYGESMPEGESYYYEFTCDDCKNAGREWYKLVYEESVIDD